MMLLECCSIAVARQLGVKKAFGFNLLIYTYEQRLRNSARPCCSVVRKFDVVGKVE